ncbi:MAG: glycosyltransferase family 4 protein [Halobacteriota archaeon]
MRTAFVDVFQILPANSGNDWYALQLSDELSSQGDVRLLYTLRNPGKKGYLPSTSIRQEFIESKLRWDRVSYTLGRLRPEMLFDGSGVSSIDADVVFARVYSYHIAKHIAKANNAPVVVVMHNVEWQYLKHTGYPSLIYGPARLYENYVLKNADAVTTLSQNDRAYAVATTRADKVFYVPYKPNREFFQITESSQHAYDSDKCNVLFYGSLDRHHNVQALEFIQRTLLPKLREEGLLDWMRMNVFGSGSPPKSVDLEGDPDINFIGPVENPAPYIAGSDVVIVPVRNPSGVKLRVLEALACKKPVVAFPEATHGLNGESSKREIITANSAEAFVEALKALRPLSQDVLPIAQTNQIAASSYGDRASDAARYALQQGESSKYARSLSFGTSD